MTVRRPNFLPVRSMNFGICIKYPSSVLLSQIKSSKFSIDRFCSTWNVALSVNWSLDKTLPAVSQFRQSKRSASRTDASARKRGQDSAALCRSWDGFHKVVSLGVALCGSRANNNNTRRSLTAAKKERFYGFWTLPDTRPSNRLPIHATACQSRTCV